MVRNLRTAGTAELVVGGTVEPIRALAIHGEQKGAFLRQYFQQPELRARYALKVDTKYLTPTEVDRAGGLYLVFRLEPLQQPDRKEREAC